MYDENEYWYEYEEDWRNAVVRRPGQRRTTVVTAGRPSGGRAPVARAVPVAAPVTTVPATMVPGPWGQPYPGYPYGPPPMAPTTVITESAAPKLNLPLLVDAAAQILAAMAALPAAPTATGEAKTDMTNLLTYQTSLAQHAKRDEQIRTAGKLARLFLG